MVLCMELEDKPYTQIDIHQRGTRSGEEQIRGRRTWQRLASCQRPAEELAAQPAHPEAVLTEESRVFLTA